MKFTREMMLRVHEIARELEGDYIARLVLAFREVTKEKKEDEKIVLSEEIVEMIAKKRGFIKKSNQKHQTIERCVRNNEWFEILTAEERTKVTGYKVLGFSRMSEYGRAKEANPAKIEAMQHNLVIEILVSSL